MLWWKPPRSSGRYGTAAATVTTSPWLWPSWTADRRPPCLAARRMLRGMPPLPGPVQPAPRPPVATATRGAGAQAWVRSTRQLAMFPAPICQSPTERPPPRRTLPLLVAAQGSRRAAINVVLSSCAPAAQPSEAAAARRSAAAMCRRRLARPSLPVTYLATYLPAFLLALPNFDASAPACTPTPSPCAAASHFFAAGQCPHSPGRWLAPGLVFPTDEHFCTFDFNLRRGNLDFQAPPTTRLDSV